MHFPSLAHHVVSAQSSAPLRVAYQGIAGAFSEAAVERAFGPQSSAVPCHTFGDVLDTLLDGQAEHAVLPIWNSTIGSVAGACAAIDARAAAIVQERTLDVDIRLCLLGRPGATRDGLRFVGSHPAALAQCARLFADRTLVACDAYDTAGAACELACFGDPAIMPRWYDDLDVREPSTLGAIASAAAADRYGLTILARDVHDRAGNHTRFAVLRAAVTS